MRRAAIATLLLSSLGVALTYTTSFSGTENPISESGNWINGAATGVDWSNVRKTPGFAFGTQTGSGANYTDSLAVLTGSWGPTQTVQATVHIGTAPTTGFEEIEVLAHFSISANSAQGYELNCSVNTSASPYMQIVRWNGTVGDFTLLDAKAVGPCVEGDTIKMTISGTTITAYYNGTSQFSVTDGTFSGGNPGIGFYLQGATGIAGNYGHSDFTATDGLSTYSGGVISGPGVHAGPGVFR